MSEQGDIRNVSVKNEEEDDFEVYFKQHLKTIKLTKQHKLMNHTPQRKDKEHMRTDT